jgi:hypothetical protein
MNLDDPLWYAALESGGRAYGLIRRLRDASGVRYEHFDRRYTMSWVHDPEGAGHWTGIGGVTDAEPIPIEEAERLLAVFIAVGPIGDPLP